MSELVIASHNSHKVFEIREVLQELFPKLEVHSLFDFTDFTLPEAKEASLQENAEKKAEAAADFLQKPCLSDDWGLIVPSLGGIDVMLQKKYAAHNTSAVALCSDLLEKMQPLKGDQRFAYFECCIALAHPHGPVISHSARCEGIITEEFTGKGLADFDAVFIKHDYAKTLAELSQSIRSRISFRRKALEAMQITIQRSTVFLPV